MLDIQEQPLLQAVIHMRVGFWCTLMNHWRKSRRSADEMSSWLQEVVEVVGRESTRRVVQHSNRQF